MRDVGAEVPANDDVPCWVMLLVELLLYVRGYILLDVVFGECLGRNVHRVLLHLLGHVRVLYHGLPLFGHLWFGALSTPCSDAQSSFAMLGCVLGCRRGSPSEEGEGPGERGEASKKKIFNRRWRWKEQDGLCFVARVSPTAFGRGVGALSQGIVSLILPTVR